MVGPFPTCDVGRCISFPICLYLTSTHNDKQGWKLKRSKIIYRTWHKQHDCWWSPIVIKICALKKTSFENHLVYSLTMKKIHSFFIMFGASKLFLIYNTSWKIDISRKDVTRWLFLSWCRCTFILMMFFDHLVFKGLEHSYF